MASASSPSIISTALSLANELPDPKVLAAPLLSPALSFWIQKQVLMFVGIDKSAKPLLTRSAFPFPGGYCFGSDPRLQLSFADPELDGRDPRIVVGVGFDNGAKQAIPLVCFCFSAPDIALTIGSKDLFPVANAMMRLVHSIGPLQDNYRLHIPPNALN